MKPDLYHNASGVRDPVAARAIRRMKTIAGWHDCEVVGRIALRDKKTGRVWP